MPAMLMLPTWGGADICAPPHALTAASLRCSYSETQCCNHRAPAVALKCHQADQQTTVWTVCSSAPLCCSQLLACTLTLIEDTTNLAVYVSWCTSLCTVETSLDELRCPQVGHFTLVSHLDLGPQAAERACVQVLEQDRDAPHTRIASSSHLTETNGLPRRRVSGGSISTL